MQSSKNHFRSAVAVLTAVCALTGGAAVTASAAHAGVPPQDHTDISMSCWVAWSGSAAQLRAAGLSAQAANIAAQLTYQDCLAASR